MFSVVNAFSLSVLCQGNGSVLTAQYICPGCLHPIPPDSPELKPVLKHAFEHFNNHSTSSHLFALGKVEAAQRQVCFFSFSQLDMVKNLLDQHLVT